MNTMPGESEITVVTIKIKRHIVKTASLEELDVDNLPDDDRTTLAKSRRVFLDRQVRVLCESDPYPKRPQDWVPPGRDS